jgi:hypothetical protein
VKQLVRQQRPPAQVLHVCGCCRQLLQHCLAHLLLLLLLLLLEVLQALKQALYQNHQLPLLLLLLLLLHLHLLLLVLLCVASPFLSACFPLLAAPPAAAAPGCFHQP